MFAVGDQGENRGDEHEQERYRFHPPGKGFKKGNVVFTLVTDAIVVRRVNMRRVYAAISFETGVQMQAAYLHCQQAEAKDCH